MSPFLPTRMLDRPSAKEMKKFCAGCDRLQGNGSCSLDEGKNTPAGIAAAGFSSLIRLMLIDRVRPLIPKESTKALAAVDDDAEMHARMFTKQERYVKKGTCGWASVQGKAGEMTKKGFVEDK